MLSTGCSQVSFQAKYHYAGDIAIGQLGLEAELAFVFDRDRRGLCGHSHSNCGNLNYNIGRLSDQM